MARRRARRPSTDGGSSRRREPSALSLETIRIRDGDKLKEMELGQTGVEEGVHELAPGEPESGLGKARRGH